MSDPMSALNPDDGLQLPATGERLVTAQADDTALEHLHRYAVARQLCAGRDVLDIACGEGYGANLLAEVAASVIGVDIDAVTVEHARRKYQKPNLSFAPGAADAMPLPDASCDLVVSFETIEHHDRHEQMMAEIKRVLRPGGVLLMSSPDRDLYSGELGRQNPFHVHELASTEFRALVEAHFVHVRMLGQKVVYGSVIAPEGEAAGFLEYGGNFEAIAVCPQLQKPLYNLCLASDAPVEPLEASLFEGRWALETLFRDWIVPHLAEKDRQRDEQIARLLNSPTHRLGRLLLGPLNTLRHLAGGKRS